MSDSDAKGSSAIHVVIGLAVALALILLWRAGLLLVTLIPVVVIAVAAWLAWHYFMPSRKVPRSRVRYLRIRLWLRAHPGRGFATTWSVRRRFSARALARREGKYIRPSMTVGSAPQEPGRSLVRPWKGAPAPGDPASL